MSPGNAIVSPEEPNFSGFFKAFLWLSIPLLSLTFGEQIYNGIRFFGKDFTKNTELIEFTKEVSNNFMNRYAGYYRNDEQVWKLITLQSAIEENQYEHIIKQSELLEKIKILFYQYQNDWTHKNFANMVDYLSDPFYEKQEKLFKDNFGENFDIVYNPKILGIAPIEFKEIDNYAIFLVQVNGSMINFEISTYGYVTSGDPNVKYFSEYWKIKIDQDKKCYLMGIVNDGTTFLMNNSQLCT